MYWWQYYKFLLVGWLLSTSAHAQQYPVQASVQLLPPYSVYLSDYANERLVVQLQLRDISKGEIPVRLRWQIRGGGVYLETNTTYLPTPNTVGVGMPLRLDGYDLAPYLRPENLLGNGGTAAWRRQAQLPEGMYTFCVQVLDDVTGAVVSNAACASAWLLRHEPPFLNLPEHEAKPEARDPQQLTFQWTPRHTGRPNANFQTEYDFRLVEIWPDDRDPNDAMQSSIPLYEATTSSTMLVYGMAEPLLIPGRRYAWQVRARSLVNGESLAMFNNQGDSEVRSFRWGDACVAITEVRAEALSGGRIRLRWEAPGTHSSYRVQFRQKGTSRWYQQETFQPEAIITRLQPSTAYEYQVGGYCGSIAAGLSTLASVGTLEEVVPEYACGLPVPAPNQESASPLPQLRVGEVIQAADFSVTVTESSGQAGQFSGKGTVALPWLREAVAQVTFQEVQINEAYQLTAGELVVTGVALEVVPEELTDALAEVYDVVDQASEAVDRAEEKLEAVDEALATAQEVYQKAQEVIGEDRSSSEPESGTPGAEVPPANGGSAPAADGSGGNVNVAAGSSGTSADSARPTAASEVQDSVDVRVQFRPNVNQAYGFDRKEHDALAADYPPTLMGGKTYSPAWKSVAAGRTDYVDAVAVAPDSSSVVVKFRTATGQSIAAQPGAKDSEQQLPVVGTIHETVDELTAYVVESDTAGNETETTVGQLNVISYDELRQKVIVVPVNDAVAPDAVRLSQDLNAIYGAAVAHWEVVIDDAFVAEAELLAGLDEGESGLLASFPRPMRQFNRAFKRSRDIDKDAYYVFLVADVSSSRAGFMPFKQQFGYIFTEQATNLSQTIAHELGHGAFRLRHLFDEFGLAKGTTDNLMDYSEGTALYKYQWDNVHDPEAMVGWLQDDDESAYYTLQEVEKLLEEIKKNNQTNRKKLKTSRTIVTAEDLSDELWLTTSGNLQYDWLSARLVENLATDEDIRRSLRAKPEDYGIDTPSPSSIGINLSTDKDAVLLAKNIEIELDEEPISVTIHGYAPTDQIFTHYVAEHQSGDNTVIVFFNYIRPDQPRGRLKAGSANVNNIRKAFTITVATDDAIALTEYLNFEGTIDLNSLDKTESVDEIIIEITRKESNEFITTGEIHVRGTNIRGATLELGKGTTKEECTPCPDNTLFSCKRVPAGTYNFVLNNDAQGGKLKYRHRAIRLTNTNEYKVGDYTSSRDGVLIHRGNSYSYSQGCILAMYSDKLPEILEDMDAYLNGNMMGYSVDEEEKAILPLAIYEYIERIDPNGTKNKKVIIKNEDEGNVLSVDTQVFENRQKAGKYYVNLGVAAKAEEIIEELAYKIVEDLLTEKGVLEAVEVSKAGFSNRKDMTDEEKQAVLAKAWEDKMKELGTAVSISEVNKKIVDYRTQFIQDVKSYIVLEIQKQQSLEFANLMWDYMHDSGYGGSSPGSPFKRNFLNRSMKKQNWQNKVEYLIRSNFTQYKESIMQKAIAN